MLSALPARAMAVPGLVVPQRRDSELVQCAGAGMSSFLAAHVYRAAAGEGAWAVFERGTLRFVDFVGGELS